MICSYDPLEPNSRPPATSRREITSTRDTSAAANTGRLDAMTTASTVCRRILDGLATLEATEQSPYEIFSRLG